MSNVTPNAKRLREIEKQNEQESQQKSIIAHKGSKSARKKSIISCGHSKKK